MPDETLDPLIAQMGYALTLSPNSALARARAHAAQTHNAAARAANPAMYEVFATTELLEIILSFLPTRALLAAEASTGKLRDIVAASQSLRLHKFIHAQYHRHFADFALLPLNFAGLEIRSGDALDRGQWVHFTLRPFHPSWRKHTTIEPVDSARPLRPCGVTAAPFPADTSILSYPALLVVQPPLKGVQSADGAVKLFADSGITLGALFEAAVKVLLRKRALAGGSSSAKVEQEEQAVNFKAIVSFVMPEVPHEGKIQKSSMLFKNKNDFEEPGKMFAQR